MIKNKNNNYFTFGCGIDNPNRNCYVVIKGKTLEAREEMFKRFGKKWAFQYTESQWVDQKHPISGKIGTQAEIYCLKKID